MNTIGIQNSVIDLSKDPYNPEINFNVAMEYEKQNQPASAMSFYLRAAEYGYDTHVNIVYASLLRISIIFQNQGDRNHTVSNSLHQAISYMPNRPEAYFLLSRFKERAGVWQESYMYANLGLSVSRIKNEKLPVDVEYPGEYVLFFQKAVSAWWVGQKDESLEILNNLYKQDISDMYKNAVSYNLEKLDPNFKR
jgi:tetratricopeptide (TPR) repeat protein